MDLGVILGIIIAFVAMIAMIFLEGGDPTSLILIPPMVLVFGATIGVSMASTTLGDTIRAFKALPRAIVGKVPKPGDVIEQLVGLADTARRDGLLALEKEAEKVDDPFVKLALQNIADGTDPEELRVMLEDVVDTTTRQNKSAAKFFNSMGGYAPTVGIVGTVISLTHVLENLSDPSSLGHSIAAAFVATFWGLVTANFFWLPLGGRLNKLAELDAERMTLIMEGALAVQSGGQPRIVGERLRAMVPAHALPEAA